MDVSINLRIVFFINKKIYAELNTPVSHFLLFQRIS